MSTTNNLKDSQSNIICGLGTYTHTCAATSIYSVDAQCLENPPSSISIVIKQNASTIVTSTAPAAAQEAVNIATKINATAGDVISVILTSSAAIDNQLNTVKTLVVVRRGLV